MSGVLCRLNRAGRVNRFRRCGGDSSGRLREFDAAGGVGLAEHVRADGLLADGELMCNFGIGSAGTMRSKLLLPLGELRERGQGVWLSRGAHGRGSARGVWGRLGSVGQGKPISGEGFTGPVEATR